MLQIKNIRFSLYQFPRLLSLYQKKNEEFFNSSSIKFNSILKNLINSKQYEKALDLFDKNYEICTDLSINMAIKACTILQDYKRGINIQKKLSTNSLNNPYIQISLIRFYMQCHDIDNANRIFSTITNKSNHIYTVMFKGLVSNSMSEKVFDLFDEMKIKPDTITLITLFHACTKFANDRAMKIGKKLIEQMPDNYRNNNILLNSAIHMFMKFGDIKSAECIFQSIKKKDIITYGAMMKGYVSNDMSEKALDLFEHMYLKPNDIIYTIICNACAQLVNDRAIKIGKKILNEISENSLNDNVLLTSAIHMLMKFSDIYNAERMFQLINNKSIITYNTMMKGYIGNEMIEKSLDLFEQIDLNFDNITYTIIFNACAQLANDRGIKIGKKLLNQIPDNYRNDNVVLTSIIQMLMKFHDVQYAEHIFNLIQNKSIITYSTMMKGYVDNNMSEKALDLFEQINLNLDNITYTIIFHACAQLANDRAIKIGKKLFNQIPDNYRNDNVLLTSIIHMFMKFHDVQYAEHIFNLIKNKSIITYNAMIKGYVENKMIEKALDLFEQMHLNLDNVTYTSMFNACAELANDRARKIGYKLLNQISDNYLNDNIPLNSAIHMLMKFGDIQSAEHFFKSIKNKSIITYNAMMKGYVDNDMSEKALDLFEQIDLNLDNITYSIIFNACAELINDRAMKIGKKLLDQIPSNYQNENIVLNSAIHMLMKFGDVQNAEYIFESMKKKNIITYGTLMNGYNINDESLKCFKIFEEIKNQNLIPDEIIWNILIGTCSRIGILSRCQYIIDQIPRYIQNKKQIQNSLIDMWGKCGSIEKAENVYKSVCDRDSVTYTTMINAFGLNGMGSEAIELYRQMPNNLRNEISHICVLNACSHSGLLDEARIIFNEIPMKTEQIITIMIDCLSRLFLFDEAQKLIDEYEKTNSPNFVMYMALLSSARNNRNHILSEKIYNRMKYLFPNQKQVLQSGAILLSNIYSSFGEYQYAKEFRFNQIKQFGMKTKIGLSWTEVNGELVQFKAHDHSHPRSLEIYAELNRLASELIEHGHIFDSSCITRQIDDEETIESVLCGHSEKLAIAFNFIQRPVPTIIQITKNLRICGDCHQAIKLIAKIRQCTIIIRDTNRIHHFHSNGKCSCQGHF
ncbi:unnamed protein product [Rotaria sordida]|uniref:DYW domain-containing protein n=1 Tax=Rotaria sordida TaxID=392033 RepID=A0A819FR86_9BILA|nr:unnamed protein product [Rotaria sordida]CAF3871615.1 unnamed protein product [Rotaria sordida]